MFVFVFVRMTFSVSIILQTWANEQWMQLNTTGFFPVTSFLNSHAWGQRGFGILLILSVLYGQRQKSRIVPKKISIKSRLRMYEQNSVSWYFVTPVVYHSDGVMSQRKNSPCVFVCICAIWSTPYCWRHLRFQPTLCHIEWKQTCVHESGCDMSN